MSSAIAVRGLGLVIFAAVSCNQLQIVGCANTRHTAFYDLLGVQVDATEQQIKKAYRKRSMEWHPDKNPGNEEEAQQKFIEIGSAFETLSDKQTRQQYDRFGIDKNSAASQPGGGGFRPGPGFRNFANFHQMFEEQMRAGGGRSFEMFFGGSRGAIEPKMCERVVEGRTIQLRCKHPQSTIQSVRFASYVSCEA